MCVAPHQQAYLESNSSGATTPDAKSACSWASTCGARLPVCAATLATGAAILATGAAILATGCTGAKEGGTAGMGTPRAGTGPGAVAEGGGLVFSSPTRVFMVWRVAGFLMRLGLCIRVCMRL